MAYAFIEVRGVLRTNQALELLYNFDMDASPTREITAGDYTPVPLDVAAEPATLLGTLTWTDPEKTMLRSGRIIQFQEMWEPRKKVVDRGVKRYDSIATVAELKKELEARYQRARVEMIVRNQRRFQGHIVAFRQADGVWGTQ